MPKRFVNDDNLVDLRLNNSPFQSKQRSRAHSFEVMNREKRQFVHECCSHFGVESESYDAEPKRNVVAVAYRDRIWMPSHSIVDVVTMISEVLPERHLGL